MSGKDELMNGTAPTAAVDPTVPVGDPSVIRSVQHFLNLAQQGKIVGLALVVIDPMGNAFSSIALPPNPTALQIANGALFGLMRQIEDMVARFRQQQQVSSIIKPGMFRPQ